MKLGSGDLAHGTEKNKYKWSFDPNASHIAMPITTIVLTTTIIGSLAITTHAYSHVRTPPLTELVVTVTSCLSAVTLPCLDKMM